MAECPSSSVTEVEKEEEEEYVTCSTDGCTRKVPPDSDTTLCCSWCGTTEEKSQHRMKCDMRTLELSEDGRVDGDVHSWKDLHHRYLQAHRIYVINAIEECIHFLPSEISCLIADFSANLMPMKRKVWIPEKKLRTTMISTEINDRSIWMSNYGGIPYLKKTDKWPHCQECSEQMPMVMQIVMDTLSNDIIDSLPPPFGLDDSLMGHCIQVYQCKRCGLDKKQGRCRLGSVFVREMDKDDYQLSNDLLGLRSMIRLWTNQGFEKPFQLISEWNQSEHSEIPDDSYAMNMIDPLPMDNVISNIGMFLFKVRLVTSRIDPFYNVAKLGGYSGSLSHSIGEWMFAECPLCSHLINEFLFQSENLDESGVIPVFFCPNHPKIMDIPLLIFKETKEIEMENEEKEQRIDYFLEYVKDC